MNKYTNIYLQQMDKLAFAGLLRPALSGVANFLTKPVTPKMLGGIGVTGVGGALGYNQLTGEDTILGKARDATYNLFGAQSPTDRARDEIASMELDRLKQRSNAIESGLPVLGSSSMDGQIKGPSGAVSFLGSGTGKNQVEAAKQTRSNQDSASLRAASNPKSNAFVTKSEGTPNVKTQNGMVEVRRAEAVSPTKNTTTAQKAGPSDSFLARVMGSYDPKSSLDQRKAEAIRKIYRDGISPNEIYRDKGYIQASRR